MKSYEWPERSSIIIAEIENIKAGLAYGTSWQVRIPAKLTGGNRERQQFPTEDEAKRHAEDRLLALRKHGSSFAEIPPTQQKEAIAAWGLLKEAGISFMEAARVAIDVLRPAGGTRTLAQVCSEMSTSKEARAKAGEMDMRTVGDFKQRTERLVKALGTKPVNLVTVDDVKDWLDGLRKCYSQRTTLNHRNCVAEVLRHAKASRYVKDNVMEFFTREDYARLGGEKAIRKTSNAKALSVEDAGKLLNAAAAEKGRPLLGSLVLRLFCGLRTAETYKMDWKDIHDSDSSPFVHVPETIAKKRRNRLVTLPENALAWLSLCTNREGLVCPGNDQNRYGDSVAKLARSVRVKIPKNGTRDSFGSYHYALHGDSVRTAALMGHKQGDDVLFAHYRQLVRKEDAERYFALSPDAEGKKVVRFSGSIGKAASKARKTA
ncbi:site-specific integrase [Termitidicoccus mucosus]|uniref:Tyr recombinase domain-containing protein n=1 Tax=Termitidicoccus mucosus TaxID=1184151 RepID=A0A178IMA9_9BACT|nr:hypothetical protein AW736_00580 [Opitutaceae bacterium TSB47]